MVDMTLSSPAGRAPPGWAQGLVQLGPPHDFAPHDFASLSSLRMEDLIPGPMDHLQPPDVGELGQTQVGVEAGWGWVGGRLGSRPSFCMTKPGAPSRRATL